MRLNKYEARNYRAAQTKYALQGRGLYVYQNNTKGDLMLPKPTASGMTKVGVDQQFQGDDYFMAMVRDHQCRLVREIISPEQEQQMNENKEKEEKQAKLLLDQPDVITEQGTVEFVADGDVQQLQEGETQEKPDVLLNEDPVDGIDIVLD